MKQIKPGGIMKTAAMLFVSCIITTLFTTSFSQTCFEIQVKDYSDSANGKFTYTGYLVPEDECYIQMANMDFDTDNQLHLLFIDKTSETDKTINQIVSIFSDFPMKVDEFYHYREPVPPLSFMEKRSFDADVITTGNIVAIDLKTGIMRGGKMTEGSSITLRYAEYPPFITIIYEAKTDNSIEEKLQINQKNIK